MQINLVLPYIRRLKRQKENIKAYVCDYNNTLKKTLQDTGIFSEITEELSEVDVIFINYKKISDELLTSDIWKNLNTNGWIVVNNTDHNQEVVHQFRRDNKITSILSRMEDVLIFQKEDYSDRGANPQLVEVDRELLKPQPEDRAINVPDWQSSHLKEDYLRRYANGTRFVETGTYLGQTVELARRATIDGETEIFSKIDSVELDKKLFSNASEYFSFDQRVVIRLGDSVDLMREICKELKEEPATFWLDAHASGPLPGGKTGPCPLIEELNAIKETGRKDHTIFIDDRRLFGSAEWGGVKESDVMALVREINPDYNIVYLNGEIENDVICATVVNREPKVVEKNESELPENVRQFFMLDSKKPKSKDKPKLIFMD